MLLFVLNLVFNFIILDSFLWQFHRYFFEKIAKNAIAKNTGTTKSKETNHKQRRHATGVRFIEVLLHWKIEFAKFFSLFLFYGPSTFYMNNHFFLRPLYHHELFDWRVLIRLMSNADVEDPHFKCYEYLILIRTFI